MSAAAERLLAAARELVAKYTKNGYGILRAEIDVIRECINSPAVERITVAECTSCGSITIEPRSDHCACGVELYPVSKVVAPGTRLMKASLDDLVREKP